MHWYLPYFFVAEAEQIMHNFANFVYLHLRTCCSLKFSPNIVCFLDDFTIKEFCVYKYSQILVILCLLRFFIDKVNKYTGLLAYFCDNLRDPGLAHTKLSGNNCF